MCIQKRLHIAQSAVKRKVICVVLYRLHFSSRLIVLIVPVVKTKPQSPKTNMGTPKTFRVFDKIIFQKTRRFQTVTCSSMEREVSSSNFASIKSDIGLPTACYRCDTSSKKVLRLARKKSTKTDSANSLH